MQRFFYLFGWALIGVLFVAPLAYLVLQAEPQSYALVFENQNTLKAIWNTIAVSFSVAVVCLLLGLPLAWILTRTNVRWKNGWRNLFTLPYAIPPYVGAIGWIVLANPNSGVIHHWLGLPVNIYSFTGLVWVEASFLFTFVFLTAIASLDRMDSSLEEAARLSGASPWIVFKDISLPLLKPAIVNGFILSFLATAASFGVPAMIGGPARIYLLTTQIYTLQRMGTENGFKMAIATSVILMVATFVLLFSSQRLFAGKKMSLVGGKTTRPSTISLKKWQLPVESLLFGLFFFLFILPMLGLLLSAFSKVQGNWSWDGFGFQNFERVIFDTVETPRALMQSLWLGICAAFACTLFSFFFAYFQVNSKFIGKRLSSILVSLPFSTPGIVLALALILTFSQGYFGIGPSLYNTLFLIGLAYVVKYQSLSLKTIQDGYSQIHQSLEEAARVSGATWWQVMTSIYLPLMKPALIASALLVLMPAVGELTMTILLTGPGLETVGTLIFSLQEYSDMGGGGGAVLSVLLVIIVLLFQWLLKRVTR